MYARPLSLCWQSVVWRRQILIGIACILPPNAPTVHGFSHRRWNPQRHIIPPAVAAMLFAVDQHAGLVDKHTADGAFVKLPKVCQLLRCVMFLEDRFGRKAS